MFCPGIVTVGVVPVSSDVSSDVSFDVLAVAGVVEVEEFVVLVAAFASVVVVEGVDVSTGEPVREHDLLRQGAMLRRDASGAGALQEVSPHSAITTGIQTIIFILLAGIVIVRYGLRNGRCSVRDSTQQ